MNTSPVSPVQGSLLTTRDRQKLGSELSLGDLIFIRIPFPPFTEVAKTTVSWTNHVGVVSSVDGPEPMIAESRFPFSGQTSWSKFVNRSDRGRVAVSRWSGEWDAKRQLNLVLAINARQKIFYDTGFDLHSRRQFCSRFAREVLHEAIGVELGRVENFSEVLKNNPDANQFFWRTWFFGDIPWARETVTPASLLQDDRMHVIFDGHVSLGASQ